MQVAQQQPANPGVLILLVLCVWGAARDRVYKKAGGVRPDRFEKMSLLATIGGCIVFLLLVSLRSPEAAGTLSALLLVIVFGVWELNRLRVRKKKPVGTIRPLR